jgi:hypothetical protein
MITLVPASLSGARGGREGEGVVAQHSARAEHQVEDAGQDVQGILFYENTFPPKSFFGQSSSGATILSPNYRQILNDNYGQKFRII